MDNSIKRFKPTTPGRRGMIVVKEQLLYKKNNPLKYLVKGKTRIDGRNHSGKITVKCRGAGHKRRYRIIDFNAKYGVYSYFEVIRLEYDPNRSANILLCKTRKDRYFYMIAPVGINISDKIYGRNFPKNNNLIPTIGCTLPIKEIPVGTNIYNIENNHNSEIGRAAGVYGTVLKIIPTEKKAIIRLPSKKIININYENLATIGRVGNINHDKIVLGKAGKSSYLGIRPKVRGVAMNPVDHPMGGKTPVSGGRGGAHKTK